MQPSPTTTPPEAATLRRSGRTRTTRHKEDFIDTNLLQYVSPTDEPHAFLEDAAEPEPQPSPKRSPAPKASSPRSSAGRSAALEEPDDRPLGPDYQASSIPALRPRPAQPSEHEARFLQLQPLYSADQLPQQRADSSADARAAAAAAFKAQYQAADGWAARRQLLDAAVQEQDAELGPQLVQVLQLGSLGVKRRSSWQPHEQLLFCLGMCDKYRFFKYIRQCYLCRSRSAHELNGYYHNVWKTRSTPEADEFLSLREQGEAVDGEVVLAFIEKVRDSLVSMWDRKTMGDMPKLLKNAAAASAADGEQQGGAAAAGAAVLEASSSGEMLSTPTASSGSDSDDGRETAAPKPRQRKRPAAGQAAASSKRRPSAQSQAVKQEAAQQAAAAAGGCGGVSGGPLGSSAVQQWLQHQQAGGQQQQQGGDAAAQPAPAQARKRARRPPQQQRPRVRTKRAAANASAAEVLPYPEMPTYPELPSGNAAAVGIWLAHLPAYQALMGEYMQTVRGVTGTAVQGYQQRIQEVQQQRDRLQAEADSYLRTLVAQGQTVLQMVHARAAADQQQQQQQQQEQQQEPMLQQEAAAPIQQSGGSADLQLKVEQLLLTHKVKKEQPTQQDSAPAAAAAATATAAATAAGDAPTQQDVQASEQQTNAGAGAAAGLPYPLGPASRGLQEPQGGDGSAQPADGADGQRPKQGAAGADEQMGAAPRGDAGCGGSSSEECDMLIACREAAVC